MILHLFSLLSASNIFSRKNSSYIRLESPKLRPVYSWISSYGTTVAQPGPLQTYKQCAENARIRSFSGLYFPAFGLNTGRFSVSLRIKSKCRKIWTRKTPNKDPFHTVKTVDVCMALGGASRQNNMICFEQIKPLQIFKGFSPELYFVHFIWTLSL